MVDQLIESIKKAGTVLKLSPTQTTNAVATVYQINQKGYLTREELMQLSSCLPGIVPALVHQMHITSSELTHRLEQRVILAEEAFTELSAAIQKQFLIILPPTNG